MPDIEIIQGKAQRNLKIPNPKGFIYRVLKKEDITIEAGILLIENAAASSLGTTVSTSEEGNFTIENEASFRLTKQSWEILRKEGIPDKIVKNLKPLEDRSFTNKEEFLKAVKEHIENELTDRDKELILKHAGNDNLKNNTQTNDRPIKWIVTDFHRERILHRIILTRADTEKDKIIPFNMKMWGGSIFFSTFPGVESAFAENSSSISIKFPEQKTEKALIEFGKTDNNGNLETPGSVTLTNIEIGAFSFPTNLSLRIGDQPPFFEHRGELAPGVPVPLPDFSEEINSYLENNPPGEEEEQLVIPLVVHSISDGKIIFKVDAQNVSDKENITDFGFDLQGILSSFYSTVDSEKSVQQIDLDFDGTNKQALFLSIPENASISEASLQIKGRLSKDRLLLTNTAESSRFGALGSEDFLLAQRFQLKEERKISAVDLELEFLTEEAKLSMAIHPDFNKQPSNTPLPDSIVEFQFPVPGQIEKVDKSTLIQCRFPAAPSLKEGQYWIVLAVAQGQIIWRINDAHPENPEGFVFTRLDRPIHWIERKQPETNESVSGAFRIHFLPEDTSDVLTVKIGETAGNIPGIENSGDIDIEVQTLNVKGEETHLTKILQEALSTTRIPFVFSTPSTGHLNISKLFVKFKEE